MEEGRASAAWYPRRGCLRPPISFRAAFTSIELLVVVSVIALLVATLLPSLGRARGQARSAVCASNLHQFGVAFTTYQAEYNGYQPRGGTYTSRHWIMLVVRQIGDKRKYTHVNQVPVELHPVFSCPERVITLPTPFIDYVLNAFDVRGKLLFYWPEVQEPQPLSEWRRPDRVLLIGDAAFEGPPDRGGGTNMDGVLRQNRQNHPAAMKLRDTALFDASRHASLDRMDLFDPAQLQTRSGRRAGTITHLRSYCNWLHADGHEEAVKWLNGKRTEREWLRMYGVKNP